MSQIRIYWLSSSSSAGASGQGCQQASQSAVHLTQINKSSSYQAKLYCEVPVCTLTHCHLIPKVKPWQQSSSVGCFSVTAHSGAAVALISGVTVWLCALSNVRNGGWRGGSRTHRTQTGTHTDRIFPLSLSVLSHRAQSKMHGLADSSLMSCRMFAMK